MAISPTERINGDRLNIADYFLDDRIREGRGNRVALRTASGQVTYAQVSRTSNRIASLLTEAGCVPGDRVMIALPDTPLYPAALFGILKAGCQVVMVNPHLGPEQVGQFYAYVEPRLVLTTADRAHVFGPPPGGRALVLDGEHEAAMAEASEDFETVATRPEDAAIWLFSGGTTGQPKGVLQSHRSFANTTECYGKGVLGLTEDDVTLSVPKLYFGYATGSNLLFPFAVGASAALFPERCTADELFAQIRAHRPTVLVNVPTMVNHLVSHDEAGRQDLSCLRLATSAGEPLPPELHHRWNETFGVDLLDGLGTAEMWHIFLSNRPGDVKPGTLGKEVPGFRVTLIDDDGEEVPPGQVGRMKVCGGSRAIEYWRRPDLTAETFQGDCYVSGDMMSRSEDGYFSYQGRADDMLKVSGKWLSPGEVENCLLEYAAVREAAVVGVSTEDGLIKPHAFVVLTQADHGPDLESRLQSHVKSRLEPYKYPRTVHFREDLPRTHLGKVDRGALKRAALET